MERIVEKALRKKRAATGVTGENEHKAGMRLDSPLVIPSSPLATFDKIVFSTITVDSIEESDIRVNCIHMVNKRVNLG